MGNEQKKALLQARNSFKVHLMENPNFFGNLLESKFKAKVNICCNTYFEELKCVGYHPQQKTLEAVVYVYQPSGYGTDNCGAGTPEFVRFYLSYDNGSTWEDQGMTSFQAYNIPQGTDAGKHLEFAASLAIDPKDRYCMFDTLIQVRAILSWNDPPPQNHPGWKPVWGNVLQCHIQVEPKRALMMAKFIELSKMKIAPELISLIDENAVVKIKEPELGAAELAELYQHEKVPAHRFAFKEITGFVEAKAAMGGEQWKAMMPKLQVDPKLIEKLFLMNKGDGDTSYEELRCIGLDPNFPNMLVGVIQIKKPSGYSGGPCTKGSTEYVTFWGDFNNNGTFETCLGTAKVQVYDQKKIPAGGICYAVRLPVDLSKYRTHCMHPRVVRIRAILSWNVPVPCNQPNKVPVWGNREETLIHISPQELAPGGKIAILGGIPVSYISNVDGLTTSDAKFALTNLPADNLGRKCPFGGRISFQGVQASGIQSYKIEVVEVDPMGNPIGVPQPVVTPLLLVNSDGTTHKHYPDAATYCFDYLDGDENVNSLMGLWDSSGNSKWLVRLTTYTGKKGLGSAMLSDTHYVQLDNKYPEASIEILTGAGNCGKFAIGQVLSGKFVFRDNYPGNYSVHVLPGDVNPAGVGVPVPSSGNSNTALSPGDTWTLDTSNMVPCGYVIRVSGRDRAIVNSGYNGHWNSDSAGFCLELPKVK